MDAKIPVPFFSSKQIDLSIEWSALLHASLVGKIKFIDPGISFVQGPTEKESQNGGGTNFIATIKKLFPVKINRFDVQIGSDIVPDANSLRVVTRTVKIRPARTPRAHRHESGEQK